MAIPSFLEAGAYGVLNDVLSIFHDNEGYAQPSRYEVLIFAPSKRGGAVNNDNMWASPNVGRELRGTQKMREISLRCESVSLPGRNLSTGTDSNIYGPVREIVEGVTFTEDLTMVFQASSGLDERVFFENWQKQAFNEQTWDVQYYNDYMGMVEIFLLDKQDQRRYGLRLWEAFPKTVVATELGYGTTNEIIKTSVNMAFRYWTALTVDSRSASLGDRMFETIVNTAERTLINQLPSTVRKLGF